MKHEEIDMIVEPLDQFPRYFHLHPLFQKAYDFLSLVRLQGFPEGRFPIEEDQLIAIVSTGDKEPTAKLEAHRRYVDIHYIISGTDRIGWKSVATCKDVAVEYSPEQDKLLYADTPVAWVDVHPDCCAVFFPNDAHLPLSGEGPVKKIILKLAIEACPVTR
jgi:YhcH/YjgK/YiaL family protein